MYANINISANFIEPGMPGEGQHLPPRAPSVPSSSPAPPSSHERSRTRDAPESPPCSIDQIFVRPSSTTHACVSRRNVPFLLLKRTTTRFSGPLYFRIVTYNLFFSRFPRVTVDKHRTHCSCRCLSLISSAISTWTCRASVKQS